ncbi:MAG: hypothetical protein R3263_06040 [Myxococcota bacterium]|nr:hypothetical protein [Myxococcota bacterium]
MDRPLWRIFLPILILVLGIQRAGLAAMSFLGETHPLLGVAHGVEVVVAVVAAVGLWLGHVWSAGAVVALGVALAATTLLEGFYLGVRAPVPAVAWVLMYAIAAGALGLLLRRELRAPAVLGDADDPEDASPTRPEERHPKRTGA